MKNLIYATILLFVGVANAKNLLEVRTIHGTKHVQIVLKNEKGNASISLQSNKGTVKNNTLSQKE